MTTSTWLFQANPNRYRINDSLRVEQEELWNLNQHRSSVRIGDRVLIWVSGKDAGIYAVGTVTADPIVMSDSFVGQGYWIDKNQGKQAKARVPVRYDRVFVERPLRKAYLEALPALGSMTILRAPRGTNFAVSKEEWTVIEAWLSNPKEYGSR